VTPVNGYQISYVSLDFRFTIQNGGTLEVFSSVDNFTSSIYSNNAIGSGGVGTTDTISLSSLGTQTDPLEFRFYGSGSSNYAQRGIGLAFSANNSADLVLNGTTSLIPEPSTVALLGLGTCGLLLCRRRRGKSAQ